MTAEHWKDEPERQDFPAARSYLSLLVEPGEANKIVKALRDEPDAAHYKAKDILRASRLPLLPLDDPEVAKDLAKVKAGTKLSPVLVVRGDPLWVADGYHRICASYHLDEDAEIPCRIVARRRVRTGHKRERRAR
ncbi:MAG TPA: hypothetical protein VFN61_02920 [Acidimicrobiales bacterium]|nr:hypothetical protein [Acidimicrobiales bacterium]